MKTTNNLLMPAALLAAAITGFALPSITVQPADQIANQGFSATFKVTATTTNPPLSYQWFFASNAIAGAITNVLAITNTQPTNAGGYFVVVTDADGSITSRTAALTVVLPAVLDPKLSANIRLGEDSPLLTNRLAQGEVHIARSFTDPNLIVAAFQDGMASTHTPRWACSYAASADGGLTWNRDFIPGLSLVSGGTNLGGADNVAAFDGQGNAYIASLTGSTLNYAEQMVINKSTNGGQTFKAPLPLTTGSSTDWPDKEWLAINTFPDSPTAGRLVVVYARGGGSGAVLDGRTVCLLSDDQGESWSEQNLIPTIPKGAIAHQVVFLPDGSLAVMYWRPLVAGSFVPGRIEMVLSQDGGATFGAPAPVLDMSGIDYGEPTLVGGRLFPSAGADRQAGVIYMAIQAQISGTPRILFTKSIDKGSTWSAPVAVNDTPSRASIVLPALAVSPDGQHVTIEFYDKRNQTATSASNYVDLYLAESFDGGDTWEPNIRLSEFSSDIRFAPTEGSRRFLGDYQAMVPSLNFETPAVACWIDTRAGNSDPYVVRINRTKGTTFETWRKLRFTTNDLANLAVSGEAADPEGDGIPNLAEYACGLEPTRADAGPLKFAQGASGPGATANVSYERLAVLSDLQFAWETSTNLFGWTPASPTLEQVGAGRDPWMLPVAATFTAGDQVRFFRLALSRVPPAP